MGLLEKLKNTFFEEEYVEVEEAESGKKKAQKEVNPIAKKVEVVEKKQEVREIEEFSSTRELAQVTETLEIESQADTELLKTEVELPYFEDEDFVETDYPSTSYQKEDQKKVYGEDPEEIYSHLEFDNSDLNKGPYKNTKEGKSNFKPTPIISPIYGILDKNYRKEEVVDKKDKPSSYVSRKNADLDSVRRKAFGGLEEDFNYVEAKEEKDDLEDNLLYDMTDTDGTPAVNKVTLADAEEYFEDLGLEYNIDYKDVRHERATGRRSQVTPEGTMDSSESFVNSSNRFEETEDFRAISNMDEASDESREESSKLEDNLFDLVDSMYEDKE
ncbi:MAG: hypothetical protein HFG40_00220 [Bacilli bacterium]|nr:hypothetical protein [Bacilli bacterium]